MLEKFINLNKEKFDNNILEKVVTSTKENKKNYGNIQIEKEQIKSYFNNLKLNYWNLEYENILDIGSGTIRFDKYVKEKYQSEVYSLDLDKESLGNDHEHEIICKIGEQKIELPNNMFGLVISHGALPEVLVKIDKEKNNINETESERELNLFFDESYRILRDFGEIRISISSLNYLNKLINEEDNVKYKQEHFIFKQKQKFIRDYLTSKYKDKLKVIKIDKNSDLIIIEKIPKENPNFNPEKKYNINNNLSLDKEIIKKLNKENGYKFIGTKIALLKLLGIKNIENIISFRVKKYLNNLELSEKDLKNKTILDIGSADNPFAEYCELKYNSKVYCLDLEKDYLGEKHTNTIIADATKPFPIENDKFDLILSEASMPHVLIPLDEDNGEIQIKLTEEKKNLIKKDIINLFEESYRVLKPEGEIKFSTFSVKEERSTYKHFSDIMFKQLVRVKLIKDTLKEFKLKHKDIQYEFIDNENTGLIIIKKLKSEVENKI